jgi:polysaccharide biosynthesis protein PslH
LVALTEEPFDRLLVSKLQEYCHEVYVIPHEKWKSMLQAVWGLLSGMPVNVGYFYRETTRRKIEAIIEKTQPDAIYVQLLRMAPYVKNIHSAGLFLDFMDAFSLRVLRRASQSPPITGWLWKMEGQLLKRYERVFAKRFHHRFVIAPADKKFLEEHGNTGPLDILPNGVDTVFYQPRGVGVKQYDMVFVGNMSYHPNVLAARYLVREIGIPLRRRRPDLRILIAGANPTEVVRKMQNDWVTVSGFLPDIREAYESGKIFVAPIFVGSGVQNKILEAMAMELPCITSGQVVDAIGGIRELVLSAESPSQFHKHIENLLSDPTQCRYLGRKSRAHIVRHFDWETCCRPLDKLKVAKTV